MKSDDTIHTIHLGYAFVAYTILLSTGNKAYS